MLGLMMPKSVAGDQVEAFVASNKKTSKPQAPGEGASSPWVTDRQPMG